MRCPVARDLISRLAGVEEPIREQRLSSHLEICPACSQALQRHRKLLMMLNAPAPLPDFSDLAPAIRDRLGTRPFNPRENWRWAALAAVALAAMAMGYFIGLKTSEAQVEEMAATYQEAFTELPSNSVDMTYFDLPGKDSASAPIRSAP